jgi:hypothetical protein
MRLATKINMITALERERHTQANRIVWEDLYSPPAILLIHLSLRRACVYLCLAYAQAKHKDARRAALINKYMQER